MVRLSAQAAALVGLLAYAVQGAEPSMTPGDGQDFVQPRLQTYIVEYDPSAAHLQAKRSEIFSASDIEVLAHFDSPVFSGAQVSTAAAVGQQTVDQLTALPGVLRAWPDEEVHLVAPVSVGKRQQAYSDDEASRYAVHWATGVDKLHERGIFGNGVKIGIVDTGIWYNHSALGGGFGPGFKVAGGYDLVGKGWAPGGVLQPGVDLPFDEQGHGSHVAGIVAGSFPATGWRGVAPEASLHAYKVFGASGSTQNSVVIAALLRAFDDGMDIITASLGGPSGYPDNALAVVANRIAAEGVVVTFAAGNSGVGGPFFADNGGAGEFVISVASADVKRTAGGDNSSSSTTTLLRPSSYTSWGGLYDLSVKPDVAAPGRDIYSCWIGADNNSFSVISGTSMATPYVAGVAALYLSAKGGRAVRGRATAKQVGMRIVASGNSLDSAVGSGPVNKDFRAPPFQVGTGLVNAVCVLDSAVSFGLVRFALNDTANLQAQQELTLHNDGNTPLKLTFDIENAAGYEMLFAGGTNESPDEAPRMKASQELVPIKADAGMSIPGELELGPGESQTVSVTFTAPEGLKESALPLYSGKVLVSASNGDRLSVPYQGLGFDLFREMDHMYAGKYPFLRAGFPPKDATSFSFDLSTAAQSYPKIFSKLKWGTRELRWDIYEHGFQPSSWRYPPVAGEQGYVGSATSWEPAGRISSFNPAKHNASDLVAFPLRDQTRNALVSGSFTSTFYWFGQLADGTMVKPGNYTMRYAALKPFGNPAKSDSWSALTRDIELTHSLA
ncbi:subtilase [Microdochium bolleyi]|uniref:Subtilase n=1 Tax=Microdochium bolleyi TaxID=196109 RepID=A0A136IQN7_9PEZI|nr:subtilase [Microdochium bolleyi]